MKIPKKIKVGAITYTTEVSRIPAAASRNWGTTMHTEQHIHLDSEIKPDRLAETFLHELLHVALWQSGVSQMMRDKVELDEESLINTLTPALHLILKDNDLEF